MGSEIQPEVKRAQIRGIKISRLTIRNLIPSFYWKFFFAFIQQFNRQHCINIV
jgi:hypothetical protein